VHPWDLAGPIPVTPDTTTVELLVHAGHRCPDSFWEPRISATVEYRFDAIEITAGTPDKTCGDADAVYPLTVLLSEAVGNRQLIDHGD
jgi:hypothetical protein